MGAASVVLSEWQTLTPAQEPALAALALDPKAEALAQVLAASGKLEVLSLAQGVRIRTFQHVGHVRLGGLTVTIHPKLPGVPWQVLLRYAYGLRNLELLGDVQTATGPCSLVDLLVHQLVMEARELCARGLHRRYQGRREWLGAPRGRIDITQLATAAGPGNGSLPCHHAPRQEDCLVNQVLAGGLRLAADLTQDLRLRNDALRLAGLLAEWVSGVRLDSHVMAAVDREMSRLTSAYQPAVRLIALLLGGHGARQQEEPQAVQLPGFLFDMSRFFQTLLVRFLRDHLPEDIAVHDEWPLSRLMRYAPDCNPRGHTAPVPRPDICLLRGGRVLALLDAKYRDLWENPLPRDMLYQLALYALSQGHGGEATILYPTLAAHAQDAAVEVMEPVGHLPQARVTLRPVNLLQLAELVTLPPGSETRRRCMKVAHTLALGAGATPGLVQG